MMVRIEVDSAGRVSIRRSGERSLGDSMTICEVEEDKALGLVARYSNLGYNDDVAEMFTGEKNAGAESMEAAGYTGYICPLPDVLLSQSAVTKLDYYQQRFRNKGES